MDWVGEINVIECILWVGLVWYFDVVVVVNCDDVLMILVVYDSFNVVWVVVGGVWLNDLVSCLCSSEVIVCKVFF